MIIKASRRAGCLKDARELLAHLLRGRGNERVEELGGPGAVAELIDDSRACAARSGHAVWHVSLSPAIALSEPQWARARQLLREAYRLPAGTPMECVRHGKPHRPSLRQGKPPRPEHEHAVFPSTDPVAGRQIDPYRHYLINERLGRQLEFEFGHKLTKGRHNRAVHRWFLAHGLPEIARAMAQAGLLEDAPASAKVSDRERSRALRQGGDPFAAVDASASALALARQAAPAMRGRALRQGFAEAGFVLARGAGRLVLVRIDGQAKPLGAARKAGLREAALRDLLGAEYERLPALPKGIELPAWLRQVGAAFRIPITIKQGV